MGAAACAAAVCVMNSDKGNDKKEPTEEIKISASEKALFIFCIMIGIGTFSCVAAWYHYFYLAGVSGSIVGLLFLYFLKLMNDSMKEE